MLDKELKEVMSHELGHTVLHKKINILFLEKYTLYSKNKYEIQANQFAAELLIQDSYIWHYNSECNTVDKISFMTGFPMELIRLKFT